MCGHNTKTDRGDKESVFIGFLLDFLDVPPSQRFFDWVHLLFKVDEGTGRLACVFDLEIEITFILKLNFLILRNQQGIPSFVYLD